MNTDDICLGCMSRMDDDKQCLKCGWVKGTQPESPFHLKPGTILKSQYLLGRVLGHGGFGITYLASDINLGTKLAIKEYFPQGMAARAAEDAKITVYSGNTREHFEYGLEKFIDEARTLAKFDDVPEIVTIKDFFNENGTAYIVMSYVEGITLKEYIGQNGGKLPLDAVLNIMLPVMNALEQVHSAGILHRDISPDNIYITRNYNVKLLDFGAARFAMGEHSQSLSVLLKPGYAPAEQYRSKGKQGPWTDVYAVGATMYKTLTGEVPPESMERYEEDELKPISVSLAPASISDAILKAMSLKAADRFQSIEEFKNELLSIDKQEVKPVKGHTAAFIKEEAVPAAVKAEKISETKVETESCASAAESKISEKAAKGDENSLALPGLNEKKRLVRSIVISSAAAAASIFVLLQFVIMFMMNYN